MKLGQHRRSETDQFQAVVDLLDGRKDIQNRKAEDSKDWQDIGKAPILQHQKRQNHHDQPAEGDSFQKETGQFSNDLA